MLKLTGFYIYPIKSLGGIALTESLVQERGLQYDRRWMLVNDQGKFMSQRKYPKMAQLKTSITIEVLLVTSPDSSTIEIQLDSKGGKIVEVEVWENQCKGHEADEAISRWFSKQLDVNCRLVYMGEEQRYANPKSVRNNEKVSYADEYQYLIVGQSFLDDLNNRMNEAVPMDRFRSNLVFSRGDAFEEDNWGDFNIGDVGFYGIKPCARCVMTTIDQQSANRGKEPLKTLATFRKWDNNIFFGLNACAKMEGVLKVGNLLSILKNK